MTSQDGTNIIAPTNQDASITDATGAVWTIKIPPQGGTTFFPVRNGVVSPVYPDKFGSGREMRICGGVCYIINGAWAAKLTADGYVYDGLTDAPCPGKIPVPDPPLPVGTKLIRASATGTTIGFVKMGQIFRLREGVYGGQLRILEELPGGSTVQPPPPPPPVPGTSPNGTTITAATPNAKIIDATGAIWTINVPPQPLGGAYIFPVRNGVTNQAMGYGHHMVCCDGVAWIANGDWAAPLGPNGYNYNGATDTPCKPTQSPLPVVTKIVKAHITGSILHLLAAGKMFPLVDAGDWQLTVLEILPGGPVITPPTSIFIDWQEYISEMGVWVIDQGSGPGVERAEMDWGDGSPRETNTGVIMDGEVVFSHIYAAPGRYDLTYYVFTSDGLSNKFLRRLNVGIIPPPTPPPQPPPNPTPTPAPGNPLGLTTIDLANN